MYLNKNKKGYGWYSRIISKDLETNAERMGYMNFSFKKDCEPTEVNENGSYEGDLYFIDKKGNKRKVFPIVTDYNGINRIDFKLLEVEKNSNSTSSSFGGSRSESVKTIGISPDELPFY